MSVVIKIHLSRWCRSLSGPVMVMFIWPYTNTQTPPPSPHISHSAQNTVITDQSRIRKSLIYTVSAGWCSKCLISLIKKSSHQFSSLNCEIEEVKNGAIYIMCVGLVLFCLLPPLEILCNPQYSEYSCSDLSIKLVLSGKQEK